MKPSLRSYSLLIMIIMTSSAFFVYGQGGGLYSNSALYRLNTITTAVPLLIIAPDARAGGMGDAGVATSPDANSLHWNPAKFPFIKDDIGFAISYTPWLRALVPDINLAYISGYKKMKKDQVIGATLLYFSLGNITFTSETGEFLMDYRPNEFAIDVTYARKFSQYISGGLALRYIYSNLTGSLNVGGTDSHPGQSVATDVSMYYQKNIMISGRNAQMAYGINISNIGNKISYTASAKRDFIPINLRLGTRWTIDFDDYNTLSATIDFNKLLVPTPPLYDTASGSKIILRGKDPDRGVVDGMFGSFGDAPDGFGEEMREIMYSLGLEYWYDKQFAIRAGYFSEDATKGNRKYFTLGAGLKYNVFGLDFAYLIPTTQRNPLENTIRFTLLFDFAGFKAQNKEEKVE